MVPSAPTASVTYANPGTYNAILYTIGGGCNLFDSAFVAITVNPTPNVSVTGSSEICNGSSTVLTASGATSYTWSPAAGLSGTTGASVTASPTSNTTYVVSGTQGSCTNETYISIDVLNPPLANIAFVDSTVACPTTVVLDGSNSTDATNFSWSIPGGTPATSNASAPSINFSTDGPVSITLITENSCGSDTTTFSMDVLTTCSAGLEENSWSLPIYFDPIQTQLIVTNPDNLSGYQVGIYNEMGQLLKEQAVELTGQTTIPVTKLAAGIYFAKIYNANGNQQTVKFRML